MAVFGFQWAIPNLFGVILAGLVMESLGPNWVWYFAGILGMIAVTGYWLLHGISKHRFEKEDEIKLEPELEEVIVVCD